MSSPTWAPQAPRWGISKLSKHMRKKGGYSEDLDLCALGLHQRHLSAWKWHMIHLDEACLYSANAIFNGYDMRGMKDCKKIESSLFPLLDAMACKWSYETEYDPI